MNEQQIINRMKEISQELSAETTSPTQELTTILKDELKGELIILNWELQRLREL